MPARKRPGWQGGQAPGQVDRILGEAAASLDLFDRCQLETVLTVCQTWDSLSEAGRKLFAASRQEKKQANDADRLRKYLARFDLAFDALPGRSR